MAFTEPQYENPIVDLAGDALLGYDDAEVKLTVDGLETLGIINNWRSAHAYPLNTMKMALLMRSRRIDQQGIIAQRVKRLSSIRDKLDRYGALKLSEMQDIAGCRAIVSSVGHVFELVKRYERKYSTHVLDDYSDYIGKPKSDGYRSYHLIYRYSDDRHPEYEGLKVEMQFRSVLQHAWATAVETADIFYSQGLKSHRGLPEWRRFFALMGSVIALRERCRRIPRTPKIESELINELRYYANQLDVVTRLRAFGQTLNVIGTGNIQRRGIKYVLLALSPGEEKELALYGYRATDIERAAQAYDEFERTKQEGGDAVLVSVSDATSLRRAYPNYFLDTTVFLDALEQAIS